MQTTLVCTQTGVRLEAAAHTQTDAPRGAHTRRTPWAAAHPDRRPSWRAHQAHAGGSGSPRQTPLVARTPGARWGQGLTQTDAPRGAHTRRTPGAAAHTQTDARPSWCETTGRGLVRSGALCGGHAPAASSATPVAVASSTHAHAASRTSMRVRRG